MNALTREAHTMREARQRLRMTQFDLSRRVGCSESQITKIETGRITPHRWLKEAIAQELNIPSFLVVAAERSAPAGSSLALQS
jgi:DNA-binding XRE family transcriptional regulator